MNKRQTPIHIAFCVNDDYVKYICVTIKSIVENHRDCDVCIHVLTDIISEKNRRRLKSVVEAYNNISLQIHLVDDVALLGLQMRSWTKYAWYRLLLPKYLPDVSRTLYLDADTVVADNLQKLFALDMTDKSIAAALATENPWECERCGYDGSKQYICSGVILMNLDYWRKHHVADRIIEWANLHHDDVMFPDQDAINYVCQDTKIVLPLRFGILNLFFQRNYFYRAHRQQLRECIENPAIIHYTSKPWKLDSEIHLLHSEWVKYNKMLRYPVRYSYSKIQEKGFLRVKIIVWRILHPMGKARHYAVTVDEVKRRLEENDAKPTNIGVTECR